MDWTANAVRIKPMEYIILKTKKIFEPRHVISNNVPVPLLLSLDTPKVSSLTVIEYSSDQQRV